MLERRSIALHCSGNDGSICLQMFRGMLEGKSACLDRAKNHLMEHLENPIEHRIADGVPPEVKLAEIGATLPQQCDCRDAQHTLQGNAVYELPAASCNIQYSYEVRLSLQPMWHAIAAVVVAGLAVLAAAVGAVVGGELREGGFEAN